MKHLIAFMMLGLVGFVVGFTCPGNAIYDKHYLNFPRYGGAVAINSNYYCPGQTYIASYTGIVYTITFRLSRVYECNSNQTLLVDVWNSSRALIATSEPTFSVGPCDAIDYLFKVEYNQTQGQRYYFGVRPGTFDDRTIRMVQIDNSPAGWTQCQAYTCHPNGPNPKEDCSSPFTYPFAISVCLPEAICSSPCQHGGVCVGSNTCQCPSEWTGSTCSTPVCSPSCENGGTCSAPNTCTCTAEWVGPTCNSALACDSNPCQNGGTCIGTNTCNCTSSWTGSTCTTPVCSSSCENGGTCSAPNTCTCPYAWTGPTCSAPSLAKDYMYIHFPDWSSANVSNLQSTSWWPVVGTSDYTILASIVVQNKVGGLAAGMVITKDVDYQAANQLRIQYNYNSNRLEFYSNQGSGTSTVTATHDVMGPTLTFGTQYHVAAVRKGVSIKLYVSSGGDPAEYANGNPPNVIINNSASTAWTIGRRPSNTELALAGQITNARIYGAALNVASLKQAWGI